MRYDLLKNYTRTRELCVQHKLKRQDSPEQIQSNTENMRSVIVIDI